MRIAVDIGFGFVKVMADDGSRSMFPSVITNRIDTGLKSIIGGQQDDYAITYWEVEEGKEEKINVKKRYVGDAGMTNGGDRNWESKNQFNVEDIKTFISTAVGLTNKNNDDVDLAVGLPMTYYADMKDKLVEILESINARIVIQGIKGDKRIRFNSIFVFPQGAGAYYSAIFDRDGNIKDINLATSTVGIIDIGYRTVDYLVMAKGRKGINMIENLSGSLEDDGMNKAYQDIQTALLDTAGTVELIEIEKAILWFGSNLDNLGEIINLIEHEEEAYKNRAEAISSKIKLKWGKQEERISTVLISGGGGRSLFENLSNKFEQAKLQDIDVNDEDKEDEEDKEDVESSSYVNCDGYLGVQARKMKKQQG